ncbi:MAG TPA: hypothetical protein VF843_07745 [Streptosporangiaceae bacterium]
MTDTPSGMQMSTANSKAMVAGFALVAAGGAIAMCGMGISGAALVNGIRRWMRAQQEPPTVVMKRKIAQAKAATTAGASAWQNGMATTRS